MNLSAGSDPSLNFPKPIPFSPAFTLQKPTNKTQHNRRLVGRTLSTHTSLSLQPNNVATRGAIATSPYYALYFFPPPNHHHHHPIVNLTLGSLAKVERDTLPYLFNHHHLLRKIAYIAIRFYPYCLNTDHTCSSKSAPCQIPSPARLHRNFIRIWLSYPIEINGQTHTSPDILPCLQTNALVI